MYSTMHKSLVAFILFFVLSISKLRVIVAETDFVVIAPRVFFTGNTHHVVIALAEVADEQLNFTAQLSRGDTILEKVDTVSIAKGKYEVKFELTLKAVVAAGDYSIIVDLSGSGEAKKKEQTTVSVKNVGNRLFIETDKSVYKPGETVRFRVISVDPELRPRNNLITISVVDPSHSKIARWRNLTPDAPKSGGSYGVVTQSLKLADETVLGDYKINAETDGAASQSVSFTVKEYVLPRFGVKIDFSKQLSQSGSSEITADIKEISGSINATYTFGKPVVGAIVTISAKQTFTQSSYLRENSSTNNSVLFSVNGKIGAGGNYFFAVPVSICEPTQGNTSSKKCINNTFWGESSIVVTAKVVDSLSNETRTNTKTIKVARRQTNSSEHEISLDSGGSNIFFDNTVDVTVKVKGPTDDEDVQLVYHIEYQCKNSYTRYPVNPCGSGSGNCPYDPNKLCVKGDCPITLTSELKYTAALKFQLTPEKECGVVDSIIIGVQPKGSKDWNERKRLTLYRANTIHKDSILSCVCLSPSTKTPKLALEYSVKAAWGNLNPGQARWVIISRGDIILSGVITEGSQKLTIQADAVEWVNMASGAHLIVYALRKLRKVKENLELVSKSIAISHSDVMSILKPDEKQLEISDLNTEMTYQYSLKAGFNQSLAKPGDSIKIPVSLTDVPILKNQPSKVYLLAVDEAVHLIGGNSALSNSSILQAVHEINSSGRELAVPKDCMREGAISVFSEAGLVLSLHGNVDAAKCGDESQHLMDKRFFAMAEVARSAPLGLAENSPPKNTKGNDSDSHPRIFFPEAWIWDSIEVDVNLASKSGKSELLETCPDSITTWALSSFSVSPNIGLVNVSLSTKLVSLKSFFVDPQLPYAATRGEVLPIIVMAHNYTPSDLEVTITLINSHQFELFPLDKKNVSKINIPANTVGRVFFSIKPSVVGTIDIQISGETSKPSTMSSPLTDSVKKTLRVHPEGIPKDMTYNVVADFTRDNCTAKTPCKERFAWKSYIEPATLVADSIRSYVTVSGDAMTQTLDNLETLIKMPFGCGEQNLISMAPTAFASSYLEAIGKLDTEWRSKAELFISTGYQREQTFMHTKLPYTNSYSAFGDSDGAGSTWLTAMVIKTYSHSSKFAYIDDNLMKLSSLWLTKQQNEDGSFKEVGKIIHTSMMGGEGKKGNDIALTAFVLVSLLEATENTHKKHPELFQDEAILHTHHDLYNLALIAYALSLSGDNISAEYLLNDAMDRCGDDSCTHWKKAVVCTPSSSTIEITGYMLLILLRSKNNSMKIKAPGIAKWLLSHRSDLGGFSTTQDTVVALQSLSEYAKSLKDEVSMTVSIHYSEMAGLEKQLDFNLDNKNFDIIQQKHLPAVAVEKEIMIEVTGYGFGLSQVIVNYSVKEPIILKQYEIDCHWYEDHEIIVTAKCLIPPDDSSTSDPCDQMAMVTCGLFTGFSPVQSSLDAVKKDSSNPVMRIDISMEERSVSFYLSNLLSTGVSFKFNVVQDFEVVDHQPASNIVYAYYEPNKRGDSLSGTFLKRLVSKTNWYVTATVLLLVSVVVISIGLFTNGKCSKKERKHLRRVSSIAADEEMVVNLKKNNNDVKFSSGIELSNIDTTNIHHSNPIEQLESCLDVSI
eukprot:GSMAST32.ASY1.ANO1.1548.1 assembled CDS